MYACKIGREATGDINGSHFTKGLVEHIENNLNEHIPDIFTSFENDTIEVKINF